MDRKLELFDKNGNRKYLTPTERDIFREAADQVAPIKRMFCLMLYHTGCRISEARAVERGKIDYMAQAVTFKTLKRRKTVYRHVPLPPAYLRDLDNVFALRSGKGKQDALIWEWSRPYAWGVINSVMKIAGLEGVHAVPKGLRHGFGIACVEHKIPVNTIQKWMGHANPVTTMGYLNVVGQEERNLAKRLWNNMEE